jgi:thymidylate kinase
MPFVTFESIDGAGKTSCINLLKEYLVSLNLTVFTTKEPGERRIETKESFRPIFLVLTVILVLVAGFLQQDENYIHITNIVTAFIIILGVSFFVFKEKTCTTTTIGSNIGFGIRQLLFHDPTTKKMAPGVSDLLFFCDHIQCTHEINEFMKENPDAWVLSDRYYESQEAYSASSTKKSHEWVMKLFKEHPGRKPDFILFFKVMDNPSSTSSIEWSLNRGKARADGAQQGKAWNAVEEQLIIQNQYIKQFKDKDNVYVIEIYESDTKQQVLDKVLFTLNQNLCTCGKHTRQIGTCESQCN